VEKATRRPQTNNTHHHTRRLLGTQLTFFVFSAFPISKKIYYTLEKIKLHQKIHAIINELIAELPNSKEDLATIANIVVVQKLFPTPQEKTLNNKTNNLHNT
jgi:hypothetical protein